MCFLFSFCLLHRHFSNQTTDPTRDQTRHNCYISLICPAQSIPHHLKKKTCFPVVTAITQKGFIKIYERESSAGRRNRSLIGGWRAANGCEEINTFQLSGIRSQGRVTSHGVPRHVLFKVDFLNAWLVSHLLFSLSFTNIVCHTNLAGKFK